jgi:hypothetical protein
MLTILLLACKSDQGLQNNNQNPGRSLDQEACECPDNTAEVTVLQEELNSLRDRVVTLESAPVPGVPPSSLVVTEYDVDCITGIDDEGEIIWTDPLDVTGPRGELGQFGCKLAELDETDLPFVFDVKIVVDQTRTNPTYSYEDSVERYGSDRPELYNYYTNFGNDLRYRIHQPDPLATGYITSEGDFYDWNAPQASVYFDTETDEVIVSKLHILIIDDKPALRPEAW